MFFEIILLSVIVVTAYLGPMLWRRLPPGNRTYAWMLLIDLALAVVSFAAQQDGGGDRTAELIGAIAIGGAVCLVLVPPVLRDLARRALMADRLKLSLLLTDLRELLQPGLGARQEREVMEAILWVRSGRVEQAVEALRETRGRLENPLARRQIDERIVMTYLYARDWDQAIQYYEAQLDNQPGPMSPQLLVEMVRAYCEAGELARAATLVDRLEQSPLAAEPLLAFLLNRSRMVFLAFVGRTTAVERIVAPTGPLGAMPEAAREFWSGVARINAGDRTGAKSSLEQAARLSGRDRRARELAENTLDRLDEPGVMGPHPVPPFAAELADRLTALATSAEPGVIRRPTPKLAGVGMRAVPVTTGLIAVNLAAAALVAVLFGATGDVGALVMAGANLKSAVAAGEWWRLPTSIFLHVGLLHLLINMYGLWILGRLVEQMFGSVRFFAVYMTAGLAGAVASYLFGGPGLSAGASGAVFGVLGAAVVELALHRKSYPERWRRALLGNLIFLTVANVAIGFYYVAIDQSAHMGGLIAGGAVTVILSRQSPFVTAPIVRALAVALTVIGGASIAYGAFGVATTRYEDTLARYDWRPVEAGGMRWQQPQPWDEVELPGIFLERGGASELLDALVSQDEELARQSSMRVATPPRKLVPLPDPWQSRELTVLDDGLGGEQRLRMVYFARSRPGGLVWVGVMRIPEVLAPRVGGAMLRILGSVEQVAAEPVPMPEPEL
jgi:rhomboid protease GluP